MKPSVTNSPSTIKVQLGNRFAVFDAMPGDVYEKLQRFWSFTPKGVWYMPKFKSYRTLKNTLEATQEKLDKIKKDSDPKQQRRVPVLEEQIEDMTERLSQMWDGRLNMLHQGRMSAGLFRATRKEAAEKLGVTFDVDRGCRRHLDIEGDAQVPSSAAFAHQDYALAAMIRSAHKGGGMLLSATGSGKTKVAADFFGRVDCYCLFVVDQVKLLYQQQKELEHWLNEKVGIVGDSDFQPERVTVATIQTLNVYRRTSAFKEWFRNIDVMIVDELHEALAKRNFDVLQEVAPAVVYGLTATLQMGQKEVRYKAFAFAGPVIFEFPVMKGIKRETLSPVKVLQILFPEEEDAEVSREITLFTQVSGNQEKLDAAGGIVYLLRQMNRRIILLVDRQVHVEALRAQFKTDRRFALAYGPVKQADRLKAIDRFENGEIDLLVASKIFKKGVNIRRVDAMIDMAEMTSKNDAMQKLGRTLRLHEDKSEAWYFDIGTQGPGRFGKAARSRKAAFTRAKIEVKTVKVCNAEQAIEAVRKFILRNVSDRAA